MSIVRSNEINRHNESYVETYIFESNREFVLDISNDSIQNSQKRSKTSFEATKIHHFPLVSARSTAHSDKLNVHANDIYVELIENEVSTTGSW